MKSTPQKQHSYPLKLEIYLNALIHTTILPYDNNISEYTIFVVEQNEPVKFNKASLMNIGYTEAMNLRRFDCIVFHDVDLMMENDRAIFHCSDNPVHYAAAINTWHYRTLYPEICGGVMSLTPEQFENINGFSNRYFGWGGEDDDFGIRLRQRYKIERLGNKLSRHTRILHERDTLNQRNDFGHRILRRENRVAATSRGDGLNTVQYRLLQTELLQFFTHILADIIVPRRLWKYYKAGTESQAVRHRYHAIQGACLTGENSTLTDSMSKVACRYHCDVTESCRTFVYYHRDREEPLCHLFNHTCSETDNSTLATTFIKHSGHP